MPRPPLRELMLQNTKPVYFIDWCLFSALGMEEYIGNIHFICATDTFGGLHPNIFVPKSFQYNNSHTCEQVLNALLKNVEVIDFIKSKENGKLLTWFLDEESELLAAQLGLEICLPSVAIRHQWDNKINTNRLAEKAGVPCVPYIISPIENYEHLQNISAHLGEKLVVQMPHGLGGETTFFISNEADFTTHQSEIANGEEMRIMKRINCRGASLEACIIRHGVAVSPLLNELIGIPEINMYQGGWSGNEFFANAFPYHIIQSAKEYTIKMGEQLRQVGYKGYFQPDFLIEEDTNTLFLGEMNLRFSGFTPLTNNTNLAHEDIPLLLLHLAEWMDMEYDLDINALNSDWQNQEKWNTLSFLHIKNIKETYAKPILTGIYSINLDNSVSFVRSATSPQTIKENEVFCFSSAGVDSEIRKGDEIGGLFIPSRVTSDGKQLTDKTKIWLQSLFK